MTPADLKARRTALGLTQDELAQALGRSRTTITKWERGTLDIEAPETLALALEALERRATDAPPRSDLED